MYKEKKTNKFEKGGKRKTVELRVESCKLNTHKNGIGKHTSAKAFDRNGNMWTTNRNGFYVQRTF